MHICNRTIGIGRPFADGNTGEKETWTDLCSLDTKEHGLDYVAQTVVERNGSVFKDGAQRSVHGRLEG